MERAESSCTFCGIIEGRLESSDILETERLKVFTALDGGYPIIATKRHIRDWSDPNLDEDTAKEIAVTQMHLVRTVMAIHREGVSIISNNGRSAGQEIDHLHVHIMPRIKGDRLVRFERGEIFTRSQLNSKASLYRTKMIELGLI